MGSAKENNVVGSGRYVLKKNGGKYFLKQNPDYSFDEEIVAEKIYLIDLADTENKLYQLQIGDLTFYYDDLSSPPDAMMKVNANTEVVNQNDLVFLGFNYESDAINDTVRKAVDLALNRESLANSSFGRGAVGAECLFHPAWRELSGIEPSAENRGVTAAANYLSSTGYSFVNRAFYDEDGHRLSLELIASDSDERKVSLAKEIQDILEKVGIGVELRVYHSDEFYSKLSKKDFDMYVGEVRLTANMDVSPFFEPDGYLSTGIDKSQPLVESLSSFRSGDMDVQTFVQLFEESLPFIPICYVNGTAYYSRTLGFEDNVCENAVFANIYSWDAG